MARKSQTATDILNVELSRIGAALTVARGLLADIPDGVAGKKALLTALDEAERGRAAAFDRLCFITTTLNAL